MSKKKLNIESILIHTGGYPEKETGAIIAPIYQTSTYVQESPGKHKGYEYTRCHNPNRTRLEECLTELEGGKYAMVTSSGMSAISLIIQALPKGSTILCGDDTYGGTFRLFTNVYQNLHKFIFVDTTNSEKVASLLKKHKPELLWLETPTNPLLKITDIQKISSLAKKTRTLTVVDNTFMGPYFQRPLTLGADIVVHSMTKFINGHSDVVAGCIILKDKSFYDKLWYLHKCIGPNLSPFDAWLVQRGLKTLAVRMRAHQENAFYLAEYLSNHPKVERVIYPGLSGHPEHKIAKKQMSGFGGMITFFLKGGLEQSKKLLESMEVFFLAESLGGVESLIDHPAIMTHAAVPLTERLKLGITDNLIRLSVGIENKDDLKDDLKQALIKAFK